MSDGITAQDSMFSARLVPWHGKGNVLFDRDFVLSSEVNEVAGLNYTFTKMPMVGPDGNVWPNHQFVVRDDTGEVVSVVGKGYEIVQPREFPVIMDTLVQSGDARYVTAGSLFKQTRMWWDMELPESFKVAGDETEKVVMHLLGVTSFDQTLRAGFYISGIRTVCNNTMSWAMGSAKRSYATKHTKNVRDRLTSDDTREALGMAIRYRDVLAQVADLLSNTKMSDSLVEGTLDMIADTSLKDENGDAKVKGALTRATNRRNEFVAILKRRDDLSRIKDTGWGFLQAATEVNDHHGTFKNTDTSDKWDNRFSNVFGLNTVPNFSSQAFSALDAQFNVLGQLGLKEEKKTKLYV